MKKKLLTLLTLALCVCSGAWATSGTEKATKTGTKDTQITGTSYTIAGTYIAGAGNAKATGMSNEGVKFRTGNDGARLVFTVNTGYTITDFKLYGVSNYDLKAEASEPCIAVTKVEVDGVEVSSTGTNNFPAKGSSTAGSVLLSNITATESIAIYFDNSNTSGNQINGYYEITWSLPDSSEPISTTVSPSSATIYVTQSTTLTGSFTGGEFEGEWVSDNEAVATVSNAGVVTGVSAGTANITYQWKDDQSKDAYKASAAITVQTPDPIGPASSTALDITQYETINLTDAYSYSDRTLVVSANQIRANGATQKWMSYKDAGGAKKDWDATGVFKGSSFYNTGSANNAVSLRSGRTYSLTVTNCEEISALVLSGGSSKTSITIQMDIYEMNEYGLAKVSETPVTTKSTTSTSVATLTASGLVKSKVYQAVFTSTHASSNSYVYEVAFVAPSTDPTIISTPNSITLRATDSGVAVNSSFTITGYNLTNGTYSLTVPTVAGLSVSPASFTVTDGSVSQVVNVSYSSTENVPANTANITATVDGANLSVAVNYSASVVAWTLQSISTSKAWDFSNLTMNTSSACYNSSDVAIKLDETTTPKISEEIVYANYDGDLFTIGSDFDGTSIAFTGQYPLRRNSFAQNGTLKFNTTVPGTIVVKFSDTGSTASATAAKRYLVVNGEQTEYWTSRENNGDEPFDAQLNVTSGAIPVPAGDITITGSAAITISYVEFTAMPATVSGTITASGYNTYSSNYPLDLSTISGGTAYVATSVTDGKVVLTKCTDKVPAATGLFIAGTAGETFTIGTTADATAAPAANLFVGRPNGGEVAKAADGQYNYVFGWTEVTNPGFYLINATPATLASFKAYLHTTNALNAPAGARLAITFDDDVTTGVTEIVNSKLSNSKYFDLQGRRVVAPQKGLYIVNGKKVVIK